MYRLPSEQHRFSPVSLSHSLALDSPLRACEILRNQIASRGLGGRGRGVCGGVSHSDSNTTPLDLWIFVQIRLARAKYEFFVKIARNSQNST